MIPLTKIRSFALSSYRDAIEGIEIFVIQKIFLLINISSATILSKEVSEISEISNNISHQIYFY
jgi:hypothetical protein